MREKRLETSQIIVPRPSQRTSKSGYVEYSMFDASKRIRGLETISLTFNGIGCGGLISGWD